MLSDEYPGQRDMRELAQEIKFIINRQSLVACPSQGFWQSVLPNPDACFHRRDGTDGWQGGPDKYPFGLIQQLQRSIQVSQTFIQASQGNTIAILPIGQFNFIAQRFTLG